MTDARHHLHKRKRIHEQHQLYPSIEPWKRYLDYAVYFMGVLAPLMTFAQVFDIWLRRDASGVSWQTWMTYLFSSIIWCLYGFAHREKPIIISNILYVIGTTLIVIGIMIF